MNNKIFVIVFFILLIVSIIGFASYLPARFDAALNVRVSDFPKIIGEWKGEDMQIEDEVYQILETRNLFVRGYKNTKGDLVYLYVVYSEDNRKVSHPPEVCYMGSGVTVVDKTAVKLTDSITATKMLVEKVNDRQLVIYWFKAGGLYTDKYLKQQVKIIGERILGRRTAGALIRLSADIKENNQDAALNLIRSFAEQIEPLLAKYVP